MQKKVFKAPELLPEQEWKAWRDNQDRNILFYLIYEEDCEKLIEKYQDLSLDLNKVDNLGCTALHWAYFLNKTKAVDTLIRLRAKENIKNCWNVTPKDFYDQIYAKESLPTFIMEYVESCKNTNTNLDDNNFIKSILDVKSNDTLVKDIQKIFESNTKFSDIYNELNKLQIPKAQNYIISPLKSQLPFEFSEITRPYIELTKEAKNLLDNALYNYKNNINYQIIDDILKELSAKPFITVGGPMNSGKSLFLNKYIFNELVCPYSPNKCTNSIFHYTYNEKIIRYTKYEKDEFGNFNPRNVQCNNFDDLYLKLEEENYKKNVVYIKVECNLKILESGFDVYDIPGDFDPKITFYKEIGERIKNTSLMIYLSAGEYNNKDSECMDNFLNNGISKEKFFFISTHLDSVREGSLPKSGPIRDKKLKEEESNIEKRKNSCISLIKRKIPLDENRFLFICMHDEKEEDSLFKVYNDEALLKIRNILDFTFQKRLLNLVERAHIVFFENVDSFYDKKRKENELKKCKEFLKNASKKTKDYIISIEAKMVFPLREKCQPSGFIQKFENDLTKILEKVECLEYKDREGYLKAECKILLKQWIEEILVSIIKDHFLNFENTLNELNLTPSEISTFQSVMLMTGMSTKFTLGEKIGLSLYVFSVLTGFDLGIALATSWAWSILFGPIGMIIGSVIGIIGFGLSFIISGEVTYNMDYVEKTITPGLLNQINFENVIKTIIEDITQTIENNHSHINSEIDKRLEQLEQNIPDENYHLSFNKFYENELQKLVYRSKYNQILLLEHKISEGGFGEIYFGFLEEINGKTQAVALKTNKNRKSKNEERENHILKKLNLSSIVKVHCAFFENERSFIITEILYTDLSKVISKLTKKQKLNTLVTIANTLKEIHDYSIIYRDLKPENIMFTDGTLNHCKLIDFGIAKIDCEEKHTVIGTRGYLHPDAFTGKYDEYVDVYAFGVTALEIWLGKRNINNSNEFEDLQNGNDEDKKMYEIIDKCLKTNAEEKVLMSKKLCMFSVD